MGNCFATMVGVLIGIPIGLKINQIQQRHLDEAGREKVEQDVAYQVNDYYILGGRLYQNGENHHFT